MYKILSTALLLCGLQLALSAQATRIDYSVSINALPGSEDISAMSSLFENASLTTLYAEGKSRTEMKMGPMTSISILDEKAKKGLTLMDNFGQKQALTMNSKHFDKALKSANQEKDQVQVRKTGKRKEIAGVQCEQAVLTMSGQEIDLWYSPDIVIQSYMSEYQFEGIEGTPLEMNLQVEGMVMRLKATAVDRNAPVAENSFDMSIPEGYMASEMPLEEMPAEAFEME